MGTGAKVAIALVGVAILAGVGYWIYTMKKPKDEVPTGGAGTVGTGNSGTGSGSNTLDITPLDEQKPTCPSGMSMVAGKCQCPTGTMPSANGCIPCPIIGGVVKCPR